ncbi:MAG: DUF58 domain-containing protein [Chloroflexota bacterium]|nr:DUF58 domain-containing protein [Chloroflexota bacterium]
MSFRPDRAPLGDTSGPVGDDPSEEDRDPSLAAAIATSEVDLRPILGGILLLAGGLLGISILVVFGLVILVLAWLRTIWAGRALRRLRVERRFDPDRVMCGDDAHLVVTAWNRKVLPLPWLRAEEPIPIELRPNDGEDGRGDRGGLGGAIGSRSLVNGWTLGPYERVVRRIDLRAEHRGVFRFETMGLSAGDLLGESVADEDRRLPATLIVRPRTVPMRRFEAARDRSGVLRTRRGLIEDPSRFAGVRPYAPGDPVRHIHWRATARLGIPLVKRFDPSRDRDVVVALDIQTTTAGWAGQHDDDLAELLCVVAASLARGLEAEGAACGLAVAAFTGTTDRLAYLAPSAAEGQAGRIGDLLARISPYPSAPFEHLLGRLVRIARPGTLVILVSARDPGPFLAVARRLVRGGFGVAHLAVGPEGQAAARRTRAVGLLGRSVRSDGDWRTVSRLDVAG